MTYQESLDFLFSQLPMFSRVGAAAYKPGLDTSIALDNYFGNPHRRFKSIHVAGTNGKGSTSHMLASILQAQGYKVGLYTSPHLVDFRERIRVNGRMIPQNEVVDFVARWQKCDYDGHPSFFELTMIMAFDYFARQNVDYAVIEVGMGGRLDSTNIISPIGCVITNISYDHTQFLGDTLEKIAAEKAGIIKHDIPVVIGNAEGSIREVFSDKANDTGAPIIFAQNDILISDVTFDNVSGSISGKSQLCGSFTSPLGGEYQIENINTVLNAVKMLRNQGVDLSEESIALGIENVVSSTGLMGRWMIVSHNPLIICDTGHNIAGLGHTMHQLKTLLGNASQNAKARIVIGFVSDKDVDHISHLLPRDAIYYVSQASVPRAMPKEHLLEILSGLCLDCKMSEGGVAEAASRAIAEASADDIIYIGGSTFIVADYLASRDKETTTEQQ